jgi:hypothetical protein
VYIFVFDVEVSRCQIQFILERKGEEKWGEGQLIKSAHFG